MLMDLETLEWDDELLGIFNIPRSMLPEIKPSSDPTATARRSPTARSRGEVPLTGDLGDQQAATVGQVCFAPGEAKNTYGTGNFMLLNTGTELSARRPGCSRRSATSSATQPRSTPSRARSRSPARPCSGCATSSASSAAPSRASRWPRRSRTTAASTSCRPSPACSRRTGASDARGAIVGLSRFVNKGHLARATLEAIATRPATCSRR